MSDVPECRIGVGGDPWARVVHPRPCVLRARGSRDGGGTRGTRRPRGPSRARRGAAGSSGYLLQMMAVVLLLELYSAPTRSSAAAAGRSPPCLGGNNATGNNLCACVADGVPINLHCDQGGRITSVVFASIGTPSGSCGRFQPGSCAGDTATAVGVVTSACVGKKTCTLFTDIGQFNRGEDPCVGIVKHVAVEVTCSAPQTPVPPAPPPCATPRKQYNCRGKCVDKRTDVCMPTAYDCGARGDCAGRIGASHWGAQYFQNESLPGLIDGAVQLARTGSRVIKVACFLPCDMYPWSSPLWPGWETPTANNSNGCHKSKYRFPTLVSVLSHQYYRRLFAMAEFDTYILVAYSSVDENGTAHGAGAHSSYWNHGITSRQAAEETAQLEAAATFLLHTFPSKTFVIENWEGDFMSRKHTFVRTTAASELSLSSMITWLQARQAGVTQARAKRDAQQGSGRSQSPATQTGNVFFSAEVNLMMGALVGDGPWGTAKEMVNQVIPFVALDMVSYSAYDTMYCPQAHDGSGSAPWTTCELPAAGESWQITPGSGDFRAALDLLAAAHNRTPASPPGHSAIFVAEFGVAEHAASRDVLQRTHQHVIDTALDWGAGYVLQWQTMDNECYKNRTPRLGYFPGPVDNPADCNGFWLVYPNGSLSWSGQYLKDKIAGKYAT